MTLAATSMIACAGVDPVAAVDSAPARVLPAVPTAQQAAPEWNPSGPFDLRRFDAAKVTQLNRNHWKHATGLPLNVDLALDLRSVMARSEFEYANNAFYHGVVNTYAQHVVGPRGPTLQVRSSNKRFAETVERAWKQLFKMPDPAGNLSGVDGMLVTVKQILVSGASLNVFKPRRVAGPVTIGWQTVHPRRLVEPPERAGDPLVHLGVEFDEEGRRVAYYLEESPGPHGTQHHAYARPKRLPADVVQHIFIDEEADQVTGYPKMASTLEAAADMRQYEREVLAAARNAAKHAVGLHAKDPTLMLDAQPLPPGACQEVEPGMANAAPVGWEWTSLSSTQPMANHDKYRRERLIELGRPLQMPLMMVLLSSSDSNFASAQFDGDIYADGIACFDRMLDRKHLDGAVDQMIVDLVLAGEVDRPRDYELVWNWPKPPMANIEKLSKALRTQLEDGGISLIEYCERLGHDYERVQRNRSRVRDEMLGADLPTPPENHGDAQADDADQPKAPHSANQPEAVGA